MTSEDLAAFVVDTQRVIPGFKVAWKDESFWQKVAGFFSKPFNPGYMVTTTTTLYPTVWFPTKAFYEKDPQLTLMILAHERVHLVDRKERGFWQQLSYALPQVIAAPLLLIGIILTFVVGWWSLIAIVLGLACIAPWPSPWRTYWEQRGYAMSMAMYYWMTGSLSEAQRYTLPPKFLGWSYYRMSWSEKDIAKWLDSTQKAIAEGTLGEQGQVYDDVLQFLRDRGLARV